MNFSRAEQIARAVLYEGYILYPYTPDSLKNQQRWTFGGIYPQQYSAASGGFEPWSMQTECLALAGEGCSLDIIVRYLHLQERQVGWLRGEMGEGSAGFESVDELAAGKKVYRSWQEAVEREVNCSGLTFAELSRQPARFTFRFPARRQVERLSETSAGSTGPPDRAAVVVRAQQEVEGVVLVTAQPLDQLPGAEQESCRPYRLRVRIENLTQPGPDSAVDEHGRDAALLQALVSTHALLGIQGGSFLSLLDPPEAYRAAAGECRNEGTWPVLVGEPGERDRLLSSPITLYDYPEVAPESPGNLFDGTEIDELLTLTILSLTDEEKRQIRETDERGREIIERTESLQPEQLRRLHGMMRRRM